MMELAIIAIAFAPLVLVVGLAICGIMRAACPARSRKPGKGRKYR